MTRSTRSARTCRRAISCGSPIWRWRATWPAVADELARLSPGGGEAIPVIRSLQRRLLMLAPLRARVERGERSDAVMTSLGKSLFWKDKAAGREAAGDAGTAEGLETVAERAGKLERQLMLRAVPPTAEALGEELMAIARARAARRPLGC